MKKLLLTGSTGFFGKSVIEILKDKYLIFELSKSDYNRSIRLEREVPFFTNVFDIVVHCAGKAHLIPNNQFDSKIFFDVNVIGTKNLLKGLELSGIPKEFIFISSVSVYGKKYGSCISENEKLCAIDPYGLSKIKAEHLIIDWCQKYNVICTILRLPLLVGKYPPGNLGAMIKAIKKRYYFNISGGSAKKSMVLVHDVVRFIPIISSLGGTYNLTDGRHPTVFALSNAISKKRIYNLPLILAKLLGYIGDFFGDKAPINTLKINKIISDLTFDDSKARKMGWKPHSVLEFLENNDLLKNY